jgi:hypothetical protein
LKISQALHQFDSTSFADVSVPVSLRAIDFFAATLPAGGE